MYRRLVAIIKGIALMPVLTPRIDRNNHKNERIRSVLIKLREYSKGETYGLPGTKQ